ncbi:MAG TPA: hypothetical protein VFB54_08300 [Burkholderiales bacterium]|nr:hypothetical protein [Burkholderiales bacterium]
MISRFEPLWSRCVPSPAQAAPRVARELIALYSQPERRFHNLGHIADCLRTLDEVRALVAMPDALELALWFHDAIYVAGARDNEDRSVELFRSLAPAADAHLADHITALILATKHTARAETGDCGYMVDIDLAGFGVSWDEFMRKGAELRDEYATQSDDEYYRGQVSFLTQLKARPAFYCTSHFRTRYEAKAQENLQRLIELRRQQGYEAAQ